MKTLLILLLFSQTLSLSRPPFINDPQNLQCLLYLPFPEENNINEKELNRLTSSIKTGEWQSQDSELVSPFNSGLFSVTFENEDNILTITFQLTGKFYLLPKTKLKFTLAPSQVQSNSPSNFQINPSLLTKTQYSIGTTNSEDLVCPTLISVKYKGTSNKISELTLNSEKCNISLYLLPSEVKLPKVNA